MSHTSTCTEVQNKNKMNIKDAVADLRAQGHDVEYAENEVPRMYYEDQLRTQSGQPTEKCEVIVRVKNAFYDVGFVRDKDDNLMPLWDDFSSQSTHAASMSKGDTKLSNVLGMDNSKKGFQPIGRLMQSISKAQGVRAAQREGWTISGSTVDEDGKVHLRGMKA